jgi:hypothetical protein
VDLLPTLRHLPVPYFIRIGAASRRNLLFDWVLAEEQVPLLIVDGAFATVVAIACRGTGGPMVPRRVELTRRPAGEATLRRHFGCDVHFDAPLDLLVFNQHRPPSRRASRKGRQRAGIIEERP